MRGLIDAPQEKKRQTSRPNFLKGIQMERSYLQVAAAAAPFNGGMDYRKETSPAVFDARVMPHPVVAPRGGRVSASPREFPEPLESAPVPLVGVGTEVDWAGNVVRGSSRKHVPAPAEVGVFGVFVGRTGAESCVCVCPPAVFDAGPVAANGESQS
jgi:hypothetical protein